MRITTRMFSDGFTELSTMISGRKFAVLYSPGTTPDDMVNDFKEVARAEVKRIKACMPSNLPCKGVADEKR